MSSRKSAKTASAALTVKDATFGLLRAFGIKQRVRQSRLDRAAVPQRLARRHRLRARPAGSLRRRHGRRLRAGDPQRRLRQPAFRRRRRQCARQYLHRVPQPDAAGHHRRPAGALDPAAAGRSSMPSARRNFRGPTSNTASSRRGPRTCRRRSRAPITSRCSRPAGRPSSRSRSTTGRVRRSRSSRARSAANSGPTRTRCRRWSPRSSASKRPALVVGPGVDRAGAVDLMVRVAEKARAAVWVSPFSARCSFPGAASAIRRLPARLAGDSSPTRCASMTSSS